MTVHIRLATHDDVPMLADIERAAGLLFLDIGMPEIANDEPLPESILQGGVDSGQLWVAVDDVAAARPVAYLLAETLDASIHIEQVTVHPEYARQRIGSRLIDACATSAAGSGYRWITLTTFRDVTWNAPWYRRIGFDNVPDGEMTDDLRSLVAHERMSGLDRWPRLLMRRVVEHVPQR